MNFDEAVAVKFKCDGAVVMPGIKWVNEETFKLPEIDEAYKFGIVDRVNRAGWASKDGKDYCLALGFLINGELISVEDCFAPIETQ